MSIRHGLLAILTLGDCYGYQLGNEFTRRTGLAWSLNVGQIYKTLERLERDGLITRADREVDGQIFYSITSAGRSEVTTWFSSPVAISTSTRDELAMKVAIAVTLFDLDAVAVIQKQRTTTQKTLVELEQRRGEVGKPNSSIEVANQLTLDSLIFAAEAQARWLDHAEAELRHAAEAGRAKPLPLRLETRRRGRPAKSTVASQ